MGEHAHDEHLLAQYRSNTPVSFFRRPDGAAGLATLR